MTQLEIKTDDRTPDSTPEHAANRATDRATNRATARTRRRYERIAPLYDLMEILPEQRYIPWRRQLWQDAQGPRILEAGVGTGKNIPFYPPGAEITAIDLTPGMLARAQKTAARLGVDVDLQLGDAQDIPFADSTFDTVVATFVFCSVPDPVRGLRELYRVVKPGGRILMLEHMRAAHPALGVVMDVLNPVVVRVMGANINRRTVDNCRKAGLDTIETADLSWQGIFKRINARKSG